jgi:hypothetical protein
MTMTPRALADDARDRQAGRQAGRQVGRQAGSCYSGTDKVSDGEGCGEVGRGIHGRGSQRRRAGPGDGDARCRLPLARVLEIEGNDVWWGGARACACRRVCAHMHVRGCVVMCYSANSCVG